MISNEKVMIACAIIIMIISIIIINPYEETKWFPKFKADLPSIDGKVVAITGTTSGTGYVAARTVAEKGGTVLLLNRKSSRVEAMLNKLKEEVPNGKFECIECDLQDFSSVRKAAEEIKSKYDKLYSLCNNAGIMATPDEATVDGYDTQMQTNHLSHFLLTAELYPLLKAQAEELGDARIVNHSSGARYMTPNNKLERKYLEKNGGNLGGNDNSFIGSAEFVRYAHTKLANSVFTYGLHEKLQAKKSKVKAIDAHPGGCASNLGDHLAETMQMKILRKVFFRFVIQSTEDGTMGILKGIMAPDAESGAFYGPKGLLGLSGPAVVNPPKAFENDPDSIKMLWETSEAATGVKFLDG